MPLGVANFESAGRVESVSRVMAVAIQCDQLICDGMIGDQSKRRTETGHVPFEFQR